MSSRSLRRRESDPSSGSSSVSDKTSDSGGSPSSPKSTSSRETNSYRDPRIDVIRETTREEKRENKNATLYLRRYDGAGEFVSSIRDISAYSMKFGDTISDGIHPRDIWSALNTIAYFILDGNIKLSGGNDCFKKLAKQKSGVGTVNAGPGIFIQPREDIHTFGNKSGGIADTGPVENVHISSRQYDRRGRTTNALVLKERHQYHIAGDLSLDFIGTRHTPADRERLVCHRGRLRDAGFEIPGPIHGEELWLMDRSGNFAASIAMFDHMWPCDGCYESLCRREWPTPEMCRKGNNRCNGTTHVIPRMKAKGVTPAVPAFECARILVTIFCPVVIITLLSTKCLR